jgi:hypothetical protein
VFSLGTRLEATPVLSSHRIGLTTFQSVDSVGKPRLQLGLLRVLPSEDDEVLQILTRSGEAFRYRLGFNELDHFLGQRNLKGGHRRTLLVDRENETPGGVPSLPT